MAIDTEVEDKALMQQIAKLLDETRASHAIHIRKLKDFSAIRSSSPARFFTAFSKTLVPLFNFQRRNATAERIVRFVAVFASTRDASNVSIGESFLEELLRFLLVAATAANKTARFRAVQMISETIMRLPDDAEVSNDLWDEVIECMKLRVDDKVPAIRTFAVRALSRFAFDSENSDVLDLFLQALPLEQNAEVRRTIVLSLPASNATSTTIINCTLDVNESVRKAAYSVLACKFPLQSISIKQRTIILKRGLADRSAAVTKECLKLLKDEWLVKYCNGDAIELLKYLDVETYESIGESVMEALLNSGLIKLQDGQSIQQYLMLTSNANEGNHTLEVELMEAEVALYWRTVCRHLQTEAQAKGSDAATAMGTEAAVYAAEASDKNDLLDQVLPASASDYVKLVRAHLVAGPNYRFATRQLLLLGAMLDFSDSTNRKVASSLVHELLHRPFEQEMDENENKVIIGDGINLGGDRDWAYAVSILAKKVHAASGEFEEVVLGIVEELAQPCRERTADFLQWIHCLAVTGLLLENTKSLRWMQGKAIESAELLQSLLFPGARHVHLEVQRVATRCIGLFGLLERKPSEEVVKQLRLSFVKGPSMISVLACKALIDLAMWHGPQEVDKSMGKDLSSQLRKNVMDLHTLNLCAADADPDVELLDLLYAGLGTSDWSTSDADENESVQAVLGEGLAKILLLSENYPSIQAHSHSLFLAKLINLYFSNETKEMERLRQCLFVFFEHYASLSVNHKKFISKAFIPVMRSMWPGVNGIAGGSPVMVSKLRKRAVQASQFMLQMMQAPLYQKEAETVTENGSDQSPETLDASTHLSYDVENGKEGLALCIAVEVASFQVKKKSAEKSYVSALCRVLVLLHFRPSEQGAIKLMRRLLHRVAESVMAEKELVKQLNLMAEHLRAIDKHPDQELPQDQADLILGKLGLDINLDSIKPLDLPLTPAPRSTRPTRSRRQIREEESSSDDENLLSPIAAANPGMMSTRSQRASKTAALTKMAANSAINDSADDDEEDGSGVTSDDDSEESDLFTC